VAAVPCGFATNLDSLGISRRHSGYPGYAVDFEIDNVRFSLPDDRCYANCDGSTVPPILNVADFTCFLQKFAAGCP